MSARRHIAIGDPQAPFAQVLEVLDRAHLLAESGTLRPDVQLVSIGDHFDWGSVSDRARATSDAVSLLSWLSSHDEDQVVLIAGNHDLARLHELSHFADDAAFEAARALADAAYRRGQVDEAAQATFLERYPFLADAESIARDYSCFSTEQRRLVELLVRGRRFRVAHEHRGRLLIHAGVTVDDLAALSIQEESAAQVAAGLNAFFDERVNQWVSGPLDLRPLYVPGSAATQWARGIFSHRPADPNRPGADATDFEGIARRRFDPRKLPTRFGQIVGHIRDKKCRELMPSWAIDEARGDGPLRSLHVDAQGVVRYHTGTSPDARLTFIDGGLLHTTADRYELLDLDTHHKLA